MVEGLPQRALSRECLGARGGLTHSALFAGYLHVEADFEQHWRWLQRCAEEGIGPCRARRAGCADTNDFHLLTCFFAVCLPAASLLLPDPMNEHYRQTHRTNRQGGTNRHSTEDHELGAGKLAGAGRHNKFQSRWRREAEPLCGDAGSIRLCICLYSVHHVVRAMRVIRVAVLAMHPAIL